MNSPQYTEEQLAAVALRGQSCLLRAAAGSGKTAVMVQRFVEAVEIDDVSPSEILAITFTEKAAAELRERIADRLSTQADRESLQAAWIGTVHSFCARLLRTEALVANLDPGFRVADARLSRRIADAAWSQTLRRMSERSSEAIMVAARYPSLRAMVASAYESCRSQGQLQPKLEIPQRPERPDKERVAFLFSRSKVLAELETEKGTRVAQVKQALERIDSLDCNEVPSAADLDCFNVGRGARALTTPVCDEYRNALLIYRQACVDFHGWQDLQAIAGFVQVFAERYEIEKRERNVVDFHDLQLRTALLLTENEQARRRWRERFQMLMVDEFQDTDAVQAMILASLEQDNLFVVGDEFQSIYGFRKADVAIFRAREALLPHESVLRMTANFRSDRAIIDFANHVFKAKFGERFKGSVSGLGGCDDPRPPKRSEADPILRLFEDRPEDQNRVEFLLLPKAKTESEEDDLKEARALAQRIAEEITAGVAPGDIAVLVRAGASLGPMGDALRELGIRATIIGGRGFWRSPAVENALNYLRALANPLDEEALFAFLAGAGVAGIDTLATLADHRGRKDSGLTLMEAIENHPNLREVSTFLLQEREHVARSPVADLLSRLAQAVANPGMDGDNQDRANLLKLCQIAADYRAVESPSIRDFLDYADGEVDHVDDEPEAPVDVEGLNAVKLMTIHRSKGLEFRVVCLFELGRQRDVRQDPILIGRNGDVGLRVRDEKGAGGEAAFAYSELAELYQKEEIEEEGRLIYVAVTRARERLILSATFDSARIAAGRNRAPIDWILPMVAPSGLHEESGSAGVFRFGDVAADYRVIHNGDDVPGDTLPVVRASRRRIPDFSMRRATKDPVVRAGSLAYSSLSQFQACSYRFYLERVVGLPRDEEIESDSFLNADYLRHRDLGGRLRGILTHGVLEVLDFRRLVLPSEATVRRIAQNQGLDVSEELISETRQSLLPFLASPLAKDLSRFRGLRREVPFRFHVPGEQRTMLRGQLDVLAFPAPGKSLIVDYKTDEVAGVDLADRVEGAYSLQRQIYALAALRAGAEEVELIYCFLQRPTEVIRQTYSRCDRHAIEADIGKIVQSAAVGPYPPTSNPGRQVCYQCPGRRDLCVYDRSQTGGNAALVHVGDKSL